MHENNSWSSPYESSLFIHSWHRLFTAYFWGFSSSHFHQFIKDFFFFFITTEDLFLIHSVYVKFSHFLISLSSPLRFSYTHLSVAKVKHCLQARSSSFARFFPPQRTRLKYFTERSLRTLRELSFSLSFFIITNFL